MQKRVNTTVTLNYVENTNILCLYQVLIAIFEHLRIFLFSNFYNYQINAYFCITQDWDTMKLTWWKLYLNSCWMLDYAGKLFQFFIYIVHNMRNREIGGGGVKHLIIQNCIHFYRLAKMLGFCSPKAQLSCQNATGNFNINK